MNDLMTISWLILTFTCEMILSDLEFVIDIDTTYTHRESPNSATFEQIETEPFPHTDISDLKKIISKPIDVRYSNFMPSY